MPTDTTMPRTLRDVTPRKSEEDRVIEARIRAHLRHYMHERKIDQVRMASRLKVEQSTVSRVLSCERGVGFGLALKISKAIRVAMPLLLEENPAPEFWDTGSYPGE